jgi:hypothetical protein
MRFAENAVNCAEGAADQNVAVRELREASDVIVRSDAEGVPLCAVPASEIPGCHAACGEKGATHKQITVVKYLESSHARSHNQRRAFRRSAMTTPLRSTSRCD